MLACYCNIPTDKSIKQILFEGGSWCERESLTRKLVRCRLKWAGHVDIMGG